VEAEVREVINSLNEHLSGIYQLDIVPLASLEASELNARYMSSEMFGSLVRNIEEDESLGSVPLCLRRKDGKYRILSGHHRVKAAKLAGINESLILYIDESHASDGKATAIQISHNEISGQNDMVVLRQMWDKVEYLEDRLYSTLDSDLMEGIKAKPMPSLSSINVDYKQVSFLFLPEEVEEVNSLLVELEMASSADVTYMAAFKHWTVLFDLLSDIKIRSGLKNSSMAMGLVFQLAREALDSGVVLWEEKEQGNGRD